MHTEVHCRHLGTFTRRPSARSSQRRQTPHEDAPHSRNGSSSSTNQQCPSTRALSSCGLSDAEPQPGVHPGSAKQHVEGDATCCATGPGRSDGPCGSILSTSQRHSPRRPTRRVGRRRTQSRGGAVAGTHAVAGRGRGGRTARRKRSRRGAAPAAWATECAASRAARPGLRPPRVCGARPTRSPRASPICTDAWAVVRSAFSVPTTCHNASCSRDRASRERRRVAPTGGSTRRSMTSSAMTLAPASYSAARMAAISWTERAPSHRLPNAGAHFVQREVGAAIEVEQHRLRVGLLGGPTLRGGTAVCRPRSRAPSRSTTRLPPQKL